MDDQNNKKGFDDFFRKNDEGQGAAESADSGINAKPDVLDEAQEQSAKPSYYYSYGPFKANSQEDGSPSNHGYAADKPKLIQDQPYGITGSTSQEAAYAQQSESSWIRLLRLSKQRQDRLSNRKFDPLLLHRSPPKEHGKYGSRAGRPLKRYSHRFLQASSL